MELLKDLFLIFSLRMIDVILMTTVTLSMVSNKKLRAGIIGGIETVLYAVVLSKVMAKLNSPITLIVYGLAYGLGIIVAMLIEEKFSDDKFTAQIVVLEEDLGVVKDIRDMDIPVTVIDGQGISNEKRFFLFIVLNKQKYQLLDKYVKKKELFMTVNKSSPINGYFR
ncbi:MAG: DUF2179 domain-containing protein [Tissierellia bacterium]|nr:DUF2179 domain-containing protein [Tissierellia bacterium]